MHHLQVHLDISIFVSNAVAAFGLNMSVFMLIGKTSALTMNIAGVIKDWLLIGLSVLIFKAQVLCPCSFLYHLLTPKCTVAWQLESIVRVRQHVTSAFDRASDADHQPDANTLKCDGQWQL